MRSLGWFTGLSIVVLLTQSSVTATTISYDARSSRSLAINHSDDTDRLAVTSSSSKPTTTVTTLLSSIVNSRRGVVGATLVSREGFAPEPLNHATKPPPVSITVVPSTNNRGRPHSVPDVAATASLLTVGLLGTILARRKLD